MSCYIVDKKIIDAIVWEATKKRTAFNGADAFKDPNAFGQMLVDVNIESVANRYDWATAEGMFPAELRPAYKWPGDMGLWPILCNGAADTATPRETYDALREYDYQVTESEAYEQVHGHLTSMMLSIAEKAMERTYGEEVA